jgi:hypothetical protein
MLPVPADQAAAARTCAGDAGPPAAVVARGDRVSPAASLSAIAAALVQGAVSAR